MGAQNTAVRRPRGELAPKQRQPPAAEPNREELEARDRLERDALRFAPDPGATAFGVGQESGGEIL